MDTFRKWLNKPKADDKSLLARFYHADRSLTAVASELDSFDGRAEPDRCSRLVSRLRQGQDKVLAITNLIMEELLGDDRDPRAFRVKFPEEVLQENLAGQLWFGAECLAAGSSILNHEQESKEMRPLAQAVTKSLGNVRNLLREQCLRNNVPNSKTLHLDINDSGTEQLYESLKIFDRLFAEFEMRYVSAMVPVKTKEEYEMQELICVLFSETLQRALKVGLLDQDKVDTFDPALMFSIPRLAIIAGLVIYPRGPLNMDMPADQLSEMFRPFRTILIKIRDLLKTLKKNELDQLEKLLCTNEDIDITIPLGSSSIEAPSPDQQNNNYNNANRIADTAGTTATTAPMQTNNTPVQDQRNIYNNNNNNSNSNNNNNNNTVNPSLPARESSSAPPKRVLKTASGGTSSSFATRCATRSPSISSVSAATSSAISTPTASPAPSPSPSMSHSIVSTTSAGSTMSSSSSGDWTDNEDDNENEKDLIADEGNDGDDDEDDDDEDENEDDDDDDDDDDGEMAENEDIVSADCASGYLIPNTNFGNLLQPHEVPLTDNFIASENEFGAAGENIEDEDVPTTSAAINAIRRLRLNNTPEESESASTFPVREDATSMSANGDATVLATKPSNEKINKPNVHNGSSASCSSSSVRHREQHSCDISTGSSNSHCSSSHQHQHQHQQQHHHHKHGSVLPTHHHSHSHSQSHNHHHHHHHHNHSHNHSHNHNSHHHHHQHHRARNQASQRTKRCSLEGCQEQISQREEANNGNTATVTQTETSTSQKSTGVHHDTSSGDCSTSSSLSDGGGSAGGGGGGGEHHDSQLAVKVASRKKFKSTDNLLHRLFVCIAGVADQLQTNFAADLRQILRSVFLMNMSPAQEELDIPEKTKESELFEFRASENDVIQENAGSNQSIYSAEEVNPELDNVFNNSSGNGSGGSTSNNSSSNSLNGGSGGGGGGGSVGVNVRYSTGSSGTVQRGHTIDFGGVDNPSISVSALGRNHVGRSRSLGDQENNETNVTGSSNRRLTYRQHNSNAINHHRNRNNSVGSNSPSSSSSSSESNSPISERSSTSGFPQLPRQAMSANLSGNNNGNSNSNSNNNGNNSNNSSSNNLSSINNSNNNANNYDIVSPTTAHRSSSLLPSTPPSSTTSITSTQLSSSTNAHRLAPPAWVPDDKAPRCMSCRTPFTAFRRRHHCRNCGGVFCGACSNASAPLPKYGLTKAVRVCLVCYEREVRANAAAAVASSVRPNVAHAYPPTTTAGGS